MDRLQTIERNAWFRYRAAAAKAKAKPSGPTKLAEIEAGAAWERANDALWSFNERRLAAVAKAGRLMNRRTVYWQSDQVTLDTDASRKARADARAFIADAELCPASFRPAIRWRYTYTDHYCQYGYWEVLVDA